MISNVVIRGFTQKGISLDVNHETTVVRDSLITNTSGSCISVSGETSAVKLINNIFQYNNGRSYGTSVLTSSVNGHTLLYVKGNIFHNNDLEKILKCSSHNSKSRSVIEIANNDILNNTCDNLVDVEYVGCDSSYYGNHALVLTGNYWRNNQVRSTSVIAKQTQYCYRYEQKTEIWLTENFFLNNTGKAMVDMLFRWKTSVTFNSNIFKANVLDKSAITFNCYYGASSISLSLNEFFNNIAEKLVDVTGNVPLVGVIYKNTVEGNEIDNSLFDLFTENTNNQNSLNFTGNSLINNAVSQRRPLPFNIIGKVAAVICPSGLRISVNENLFENPLLSFEFMLTPFLWTINEIDAKYNWWGSKDTNEIILRIFDFRWRNYLGVLDISPFLASGNLSDVRVGETRFNFRNDSVLGGGVTDYTILKRENSPYTVIRDVIIYPSGTLTIEKGTQINVLPNIGFHVYGKLELLGERGNPIEFNIAPNLQGSTNFGTYPLRLVNGSRPWEGIVEIFYNNTWGTICDDYYYSSSNGMVLCKQLGYLGYYGSYSYASSSSSTKPVWLRYLRCDSNIHHDISTCSFTGWGVSCPYYRQQWSVRCNPGFWRGIRFRETAKTSNLSHVKFERGGGYIRNDINSYVLHFDVLRQALSDIEIRDSFRGGIKIGFQEPGVANFSNFLIHNSYKYTSSYGIETSSSLTCYNCSVFGKNRGLSIPEFNINSFLSDAEIKNIDALSVPELMLRKEIRMCEENRSVVVGEEDMKIVQMSTTSYSYEVIECLLTLTLVSKTTLVVGELSLYSYETFTISAPDGNLSSTTEFTMSQHDVYNFGPGNLTVLYRRNAYSSGTRKTLVLISSRGNVSFELIAFHGEVFCAIYNKQESFVLYQHIKHQKLTVESKSMAQGKEKG